MLSVLLLITGLLLGPAITVTAQENPLTAPIQCGWTEEGNPLDDPLPHVGSVHALYVVCAPDSHAKPVSDTTGYMPTSYTMPSWAELVFDTTFSVSLSS